MAKIESVSVHGAQLRYFRFGSADARPAVILPGLSVTDVMAYADAVEAAYAPLAAHHTVYLLDRRTAVPEGYRFADMAGDTAAAMQALHLQGADLFGVSQGGMIAQRIAAEHPELVRRLALGSTCGSIPADARRQVGRWIALAERGDRRGLMQAFAEAVYTERLCSQMSEIILQSADAVTDAQLTRFVRLAQTLSGLGEGQIAKRPGCPAIVLCGSTDRLFPAALQRALSERLRADFWEFSGFGHAVYDECPAFTAAFSAFFAAE